MEFWAETGSDVYTHLLSHMLREGVKTSPRGQETREILNVTTMIERPEHAHVLATTRPINLKIGATETLHLLAGLSSLEQLDLASAGRFSQFADGGRLRGAYGPRLAPQYVPMLELLQRDPHTRQAVLSVWTGRELSQPSRDVPCTQSFQFFVRGGQLQLRVLMRSSDLWLGLPHDLVMFSRLQLTVAHALGLEAGRLVHSAGSLHLYERDVEAAMQVVADGVQAGDRVKAPPIMTGYSTGRETPVELFQLSQQMAQNACLRRHYDNSQNPGAPMDWYMDRVAEVPESRLCPVCRYVVPVAAQTLAARFHDAAAPESTWSCDECVF